MKKILHMTILLAICCSAVMMPGCGSDNDLKYAPISEIRSNFSQTVEKLKASKFDNLDFSNAEFSFPEIDSISKLSLGDFTGKSAQEIYDFFSASIDKFVPGKFTEEQKLNEIIFYDGENPDGTFQTIKEYTLTDYPYPSFETEDCFIDMQFGVLRWFDNADLMRWRGEDGAPIMKMMSGSEKTIINDMSSTDKYELTNGEISIKDAAEFAKNYLQTTNFSPYELSARNTVSAAIVMDIGKEKFGYDFLTTPIYKNVMFDCVEADAVIGSFIKNDYDSRIYDNLPGHVCMIETDKIYQFILPAYNHSIEEYETYDSIITLESAAKAVSGFYSGSMDFYVKRVKAVYLPYLDNAEPCWKFVMNCGGYLYNTFVNMHTGEIYVYIQG